MSRYTLSTSDDLLLCTACGAQYEVTESEGKTNCRICDDPRQFVPPEGQSFTTLKKLREKGHKNIFERSKKDSKVIEIWTEPKVFFPLNLQPLSRSCLAAPSRDLVVLAMFFTLTTERSASVNPPA